MSGFKTRSLLRRLSSHGVLIQYTVGVFTGQRVRVWANGIPVSMTLGTARAYANLLDEQEMGFAR